MATDATLVRVGVTGTVWTALQGVPTLPGDALTAPTGFTDLGYISEDGVTQSISNSTNDIKAWGGDTVRTIQTEHDLQFTFTMIETNAETLKLYYSDPNATASAVSITSAQGVRQTMILDVVDGDQAIRLELPDCQVTEVGDIVYATEDAIGYEVTITCYPDNTGVKAYKWLATII